MGQTNYLFECNVNRKIMCAYLNVVVAWTLRIPLLIARVRLELLLIGSYCEFP